jgi:hypothetical protein
MLNCPGPVLSEVAELGETEVHDSKASTFEACLRTCVTTSGYQQIC